MKSITTNGQHSNIIVGIDIGSSKICGPSGHTLAEAQTDAREEILVAEVDPWQARNKHLVRVPRQHEIDRFKDRRPELYGPLSQ